jgi:Laminin G domain
MTRHPHLLTGSLASLAVAASVVASTGAQAATPDSFTLTVDDTIGSVVTGNGQFQIGGDTSVDVEVADADGGKAKVVAGPDAALPTAVQFPSYGGLLSYPRAVLSIMPTSGDAFSPGSSDFRYGAVFRLNDVSSGGDLDNGDNVFQRGLYFDGSQFKLQVDHGYPSCVVRGSEGRVKVRSGSRVTANEWYRATCSRVGSKVSLAVTTYGGGDTVRDDSTGDTGTLSFPASRPASIGGKLTALSDIVLNASDQLNGAVAKVFVDRL